MTPTTPDAVTDPDLIGRVARAFGYAIHTSKLIEPDVLAHEMTHDEHREIAETVLEAIADQSDDLSAVERGAVAKLFDALELKLSTWSDLLHKKGLHEEALVASQTSATVAYLGEQFEALTAAKPVDGSVERVACSDCGRYHDPAIRCPNYHAGMMPSAPDPVPSDAVVKGEVERLSDVLDTERYKVAIGVQAIARAIQGRKWLSEGGRGSYTYDDERYQQEFGAALSEIDAALEPLRAIAQDWSDCPRDALRVSANRNAALASSTGGGNA